MKKTLLSIITLATFSFGATAQNVNIPDANFKAYLLGNTAINTDTNPNEISVAEASTFSGAIICGGQSISDLTGIEAFTALTNLNCFNNSLTTLDLSNNTALTNLSCSGNSLTTLDLSNNTDLTVLYCGNNSLTTLNLSNTTDLTELWCENNSLTTLDVSNNTNLIVLICLDNLLMTLDLSNNTDLTQFRCDNNSLTILDIANGNNTIVTLFNAQSNPNLTCIQVDDVNYSTTNWTNINAGTSFSLNCNPLSISEYELAKNITIYPNPVTSRIYINSNEFIDSIAIIDVFGKIIKRNLTFNNGIDISNLSNGIYFLQVSTSKGLGSKKFIKE